VGIKVPPEPAPPVHEYVLAPLPLNITVSPKQITDFEILALTVGNGKTVICFTAVLLQVFKAVPINV